MGDNSTKWPDFPEPLRSIFEVLWQDVSSLHANWELYCGLFSDPKSIEIINKTVPAVFQLIEENLRATLVVSFGRITDKPKFLKFDNVSLSRLIELLETNADPAFHLECKRRLDEITIKCDPITQYRNKRVAHNDYATILDYHENPLPGIGRSCIAESLKLIAELMNLIERHFEGGTTSYDEGIQDGTGRDLIDILRQSIELDHRQFAEELKAANLRQASP